MNDFLSNEILTKTFDDLSIGVGIFHVPDLDDLKSIRYVYMNNVILYEMRKNREQVVGKRIIDVAPEAYEHEAGLQVIKTYMKVAAEGGTVNLGLVEYSNHMVAGIYECSVHHIEENYVYVMLRNVTELEKTKTKLELRNEELRQFAYIASHDLKEPLNTITSSIQIIFDQYHKKLDKDADTLLKFIADATNRMRTLINDLLDYGSIGKEKKKITVDCEMLIEMIKEDMKDKIAETNTSIECEALPSIPGYETELRLLFQNLISNSIKFRKPESTPRIRISAKEENGWTFAVQDNGIGFDSKLADQIFKIFSRLHNKSDYEGTGIGLAHCKKIIELHKGKIWVESDPGQGSTFYFTIPN